MPIIAATKARCSFLSLPPELRNRIYKLVVASRDDSEGDPAPHFTPETVHDASRRGPYIMVRIDNVKLQQPALTKVSTQLRKECLPIFYGANEFVVALKRFREPRRQVTVNIPGLEGGQIRTETRYWTGERYHLGDADEWFRAIGRANRALLKRISVFSTFKRCPPVSPRRFVAMAEPWKDGLREYAVLAYSRSNTGGEWKEVYSGDEFIEAHRASVIWRLE